LLDAASSELDFAGGEGTLSAGTATIAIDFNGNLIAQSGQNGPYSIRHVTIACGDARMTSSDEFATPAISASQFRNIPQGISITLAPTSTSVVAGAETQVEATVTGSGGFSGLTEFAISGLPGTFSSYFDPYPRLAGNGTLTLVMSVPAGTAAGSYPFTVTGTSGALVSSANGTLIVTVPGFTLTGNPTTLRVAPGSQVSGTITIARLSGFTGAVSLSTSGVPSGANAGLLPSTVGSAETTSVLTIQASSATAAGTYPVTITGTNGPLMANTVLTVVAQASRLAFSAMAPVFLATGCCGEASEYWDNQELITNPWLGDRGTIRRRFLERKVPYRDHQGNQPITGSIKDGAEKLKSWIPSYASSFGHKWVHIVAHSKGGLNSRHLLSAGWLEGMGVGVRSLITMNTPHFGSLGGDIMEEVYYKKHSVEFNEGLWDNEVLNKVVRQRAETEGEYKTQKDLTQASLRTFNREHGGSRQTIRRLDRATGK